MATVCLREDYKVKSFLQSGTVIFVNTTEVQRLTYTHTHTHNTIWTVSQQCVLTVDIGRVQSSGLVPAD